MTVRIPESGSAVADRPPRAAVYPGRTFQDSTGCTVLPSIRRTRPVDHPDAAEQSHASTRSLLRRSGRRETTEIDPRAT
jgi:hypothetical protein